MCTVQIHMANASPSQRLTHMNPERSDAHQLKEPGIGAASQFIGGSAKSSLMSAACSASFVSPPSIMDASFAETCHTLM